MMFLFINEKKPLLPMWKRFFTNKMVLNIKSLCYNWFSVHVLIKLLCYMYGIAVFCVVVSLRGSGLL